MASPRPAMIAPKVEFTTSFMEAPAPSGPTCTGLPMASSTPRHRPNCASVPPTKTWRAPSLAWGTLPRTGASTTSTPCGSRPASRRTASGPTVDISISVEPAPSPAARPSAPNRTSSRAFLSASMVSAASAPWPASLGEDGRPVQGPRFLEQVRGALHDPEVLLTGQPGQCLPVHLHDGRVQRAHDQQGRGPDALQGVAGQVRPAPPRDDGPHVRTVRGRDQGRPRSGACPEVADREWRGFGCLSH